MVSSIENDQIFLFNGTQTDATFPGLSGVESNDNEVFYIPNTPSLELYNQI